VLTGVAQYAWLLLALPAFGTIVLLVGGRRTDAWGHWLGCLTVLAAFGYGLLLFLDTAALPAEQRTRELHVYDWFLVNALQVDFGLRLDPLSLVFVLLITGVGGLIHVYAVGYMANDPGRRRFFGYFNLFVLAMLVLVLGDNFVTLYLGWEGVGLASYLLIGWYQDRPYAATAAKKAFIMNRVGDVGLALGIFILWRELGTVNFAEVFARVGEIPGGTLTVIALLLLLGACGKSGQFPLQTWLPDAMAGPTPVSALIHAATMVTAGVYLVARCSPLYNLSADGRLAVAAVGAITLLIGCIVGCAYDDFKKVLAYSTVSQIGYMMLGVGLGPFGYAVGIMHLLTHGFFKAGLFLGSGAVMHAMHDEGDIRRLGGLRTHLPITFVTFGLAYLAIIGFPFLSGYYSKDAIIEAAFGESGWRGLVLGGAALLGVGLTAFYMTRLTLMVFFGEKRWQRLRTEDGHAYHPHEAPPVMTVPMILLAIGSVGAGFFLFAGDRLVRWLEPSVGALQTSEQGVLPHAVVPVLILVFTALGVLTAWLVIGRQPVPVQRPLHVALAVRAARADLYFNSINESLFERPGIWLTRLAVFLDNKGIDGLVNGAAALLGGTSGRLRRLQTGFVRTYALGMLGGGVLIIAALLVVRFS
jgi:NADH-quinone oxidoreductase subunit L